MNTKKYESVPFKEMKAFIQKKMDLTLYSLESPQ